jgi:hypothetical protein
MRRKQMIKEFQTSIKNTSKKTTTLIRIPLTKNYNSQKQKKHNLSEITIKNIDFLLIK